VSARAGVHVGDTAVTHHLLHGWGTDDTGTTRSWDQSDGNGTALTVNLNFALRLSSRLF
jgi:hypothetical protein